ncbi:DUF3541 domain-containing protein [Nitrincola nitratireducens]|uniref:DUF3541 domain-containing protein n=1 Tax=Nitrincola nitratireducens TaxID=1229521 RepID=W9UYE9_9GAMM|nr:DUF3541 domain-containing protein [Nitrincola nitratireducens]EXJ12114.1 hypothetical protein D791_01003 [Nitrincola nitratireducens]
MRRLSPWSCVSFRLFGVVMLILLLATGCTGASTSQSLTRLEVAELIRDRYESEMHSLPLSKQRHYAQRLYRITGDPEYLFYNRLYAGNLVKSVRQDIDELLADEYYVQSRNQTMLESMPRRTERQIQRAQLLSEFEGMAFARSLLFRMIQLEYYGLLDWALGDESERVYQVLTEADFLGLVTHPNAIQHYAAQAANIAWFLHQLGIADYRDEFLSAFEHIYPSERDAVLSLNQYRNKIYGLTHVVIADSRYYQQPADEAALGWIADYFIANREQLLRDTTEDILAEVGISLMLLGNPEPEAVTQIQQALIQSFDVEHRMIPSPEGVFHLERGEHRNVLAIMLLAWPDVLVSGPRFLPEQISLPEQWILIEEE